MTRSTNIGYDKAVITLLIVVRFSMERTARNLHDDRDLCSSAVHEKRDTSEKGGKREIAAKQTYNNVKMRIESQIVRH